ncbi:MAG: cyclic nucleotide-binding domain-containing protein [Gammaproteobacteria bacterium]|nr:cyclic nucleotide-binding domain-containing protein [Gammaproteobacteria bacterium]
MSYDQTDTALLASSTIAEELTAEECRALAAIMGVRRLRDGELLVSEGQKENTLFVLMDGKLAVIGSVLGQEMVVYTMNKGECAGTRAFVDRTPRKATLRAVGDATVYTMTPAAFESLLDTHPHIVYKVMRALFRITHSNLLRMRDESQELVNYVSKIHGRY